MASIKKKENKKQESVVDSIISGTFDAHKWQEDHNAIAPVRIRTSLSNGKVDSKAIAESSMMLGPVSQNNRISDTMTSNQIAQNILQTTQPSFSNKMNTNLNHGGFRSANQMNVKQQQQMPIAPFPVNNGNIDSNNKPVVKNKDGTIMPTKYQENKNVEVAENENAYFKKGAFKDGYQVGDVTKTILGTAIDAGSSLINGFTSVRDNVSNFVKELETTVAKKALGPIGEIGVDIATKNNPTVKSIESSEEIGEKIQKNTNKNSILGNKSDQILQSTGYTGALAATNAIGGPALMNAVTFTSATGGALEEVKTKENLTESQKWVKAIGSGSIETLTENLFGLFGKTGLDDAVAKNLSKQVSNGIEKALIRQGVTMGSEASEELISYSLNHVLDRTIDAVSKGEGATLAEDWNWNEVIDSAINAGLSAGLSNGGSTAINVSQIAKNDNTNFLTALNKYENELDVQDNQNTLLQRFY